MSENNNSLSKGQSNNDVIDLREIFFKYLHKWYWFVLSIACCIALAVLYIMRQNPQYAVNATLLLRSNNNNPTNMFGSSQLGMLESFGVFSGNKLAEEELYIINSTSTMRQVIQTLGIQTEFYKKDGLTYKEQYPKPNLQIDYPLQFTDTLRKISKIQLHKRTKDYKIKVEYGDAKKTYYIENISKPFPTIIGNISITELNKMEVGDKMNIITYPMLPLITSYQQKLSAKQVKKESNVIQIATVSATPRKAIDMITKMIEIYNMDAVIDKNIIASNTGLFIEERLKLITEELANVEQDVEKYKKENQLTDISAEAQLFLETASDYQKQLAKVETQLNLIEYIRNYVDNEKNRYNLIPANLGVEDASLVQLIQTYNEALLERMKLLRTTNTQNPVITQLETQLQIMRDNIITSVNSLKDGLTISKNDILGKDQQFAMRIKSVPTQEREYVEIKRQQQIKETLYLFLYQKREENALALASTVQPAKIIDKPDMQPDPVAPRKMVILFLAIVFGGCIPIGITIIYDFFHNTISDYKEYSKLVKAPVIGQICENKSAEKIVVTEGKTTPIVELFRLLRTNLNFILAGKKHPVVIITSTISKEGKSFIAINLASSLALMKKKVVLIGLDIRSPMLSDYMHLSNKGYLTPYLADPSFDLQDIIMPSKIHDFLDVIPAGPVPPNPGELIMSERLDELIAALKEKYDYILIDSAPVGMVSDTFLLNRFADATIYISRVNYTPKTTADFINDIYENKRLNNIACVLNGVEEKPKMGYGYGYGYGYGKQK